MTFLISYKMGDMEQFTGSLRQVIQQANLSCEGGWIYRLDGRRRHRFNSVYEWYCDATKGDPVATFKGTGYPTEQSQAK